jgi:hypothetical protein
MNEITTGLKIIFITICIIGGIITGLLLAIIDIIKAI